MIRLISIICLMVGLLYSCADNATVSGDELKPILPAVPFAYDGLRLPKGTNPAGVTNRNIKFINGQPVMINGQFVFEPVGNITIKPWVATLGRVLFYDTKLSLNNTIACGSCHHQEKAFADGLQFSTGFEGRITGRNSMGITNPIVQNNLFWDSRSKTLHDLSLQPVQNHIEMGMENISRLIEKLENTAYYKPLFNKAFGTEQVTPERISTALSQFVGSITSNRSRFDQGLNNNFANLTELERLGNDIFHSDRAKCSTCHGGNNFSALDGPGDPYGGDFSGQDLRGATNIGLDLEYKDKGINNGKFKIPSLRNIDLTKPYMHDGRFKTLEEVVEHYSSGIKQHRDLDSKFTDGKGNVKQLNLTHLEKKALVAFLKTLTDSEMISDPKWSNPFKQ